ncbi:hypothetical protein [Streptomyces sp. NPDC088812]|uniref:hypothetical protein n=1 Tax=Streptomyces sp. NPDC088812 TaxID=3365905 RepID=UPI00380031F7
MEPLRDEDPRQIGGFALVCRIGSGGMGQVFLGESVAGHQAAVKVIKPSVLDEDTRARFGSEVDSLRTVYGPFVAAFVGADADQPWLAVEYVPGPDLRTLVTGKGPLPLAETASLASRFPIMQDFDAVTWFDANERRIAGNRYTYGFGQTKDHYEQFLAYQKQGRSEPPEGYTAPFYKADREKEMREAHAYFSARLREATDKGK